MGSNGKAEFEKAVIEEIGEHCEVHSKFHALCFSIFAMLCALLGALAYWHFMDHVLGDGSPECIKS